MELQRLYLTSSHSIVHLMNLLGETNAHNHKRQKNTRFVHLDYGGDVKPGYFALFSRYKEKITTLWFLQVDIIFFSICGNYFQTFQ